MAIEYRKKEVKKEVEVKVENKRVFSYSKEGTNLSFTLSLDNIVELKAFKECMLLALKDINETIEEIK
jgi:hypothetical protein